MKRSTNLRGHGPADGGLLGKVGLALRELDAARLRIQELEAELDSATTRGRELVEQAEAEALDQATKAEQLRNEIHALAAERDRVRWRLEETQTLAEERLVSIGHWKAANEEAQRERDEALRETRMARNNADRMHDLLYEAEERCSKARGERDKLIAELAAERDSAAYREEQLAMVESARAQLERELALLQQAALGATAGELSAAPKPPPPCPPAPPEPPRHKPVA